MATKTRTTGKNATSAVESFYLEALFQANPQGNKETATPA